MLYQLSYFRIYTKQNRRFTLSETRICRPIVVWEEMDSNHRRYKPADLQSAPFGHSGIFPRRIYPNWLWRYDTDDFLVSGIGLSRWRDSNPRPADYKSAALAN